MATVTGYTATRMKDIEDAAIVSGTIIGDDLILTRFDGGTVNAGDVRGPVGPQGPVGEVSTAAMNAAIAAATTSGAIDTDALAPDAVTNEKLADGAVGVENIKSNAVQTGEILNGAVTSAKIADGAITEAKLASDAVTGDRIAHGTIDTINYKDNSITIEHLKHPFLNPEVLPTLNGWGGNIYYIGWKNLVFFMYSNLAVSSPSSDVMVNWPFGFRPIRPISIPSQNNTDAIMSIDTDGEMAIPRSGLNSLIVTSFFEREQFGS